MSSTLDILILHESVSRVGEPSSVMMMYATPILIGFSLSYLELADNSTYNIEESLFLIENREGREPYSIYNGK